jgi:hypothetical protein
MKLASTRVRGITHTICLTLSVLTVTTMSAIATAADNIQLLYSGLAEPNLAQPPGTQVFYNWCNGLCFPTVEQPVYNPKNGKQGGTVYVWGKNFQYGANGSLCFSEYILFALDQGEIHVASGDTGTCGAPIDPSLKPPLHQDAGATVVIAGGGDGLIVDGNGKYAGWTGTYTDRVFVGFGEPTSGVGGIVYYDQLWFSISSD